MVDWKNVGVPIAVAVITLIGGSYVSIVSALFKPSILIVMIPSNKDIHKVRITAQNNGIASAKDMRLTIVSPHKIDNTDIFATENYTKIYNNASSFAMIIPRFVQGKGSLINIIVSTDHRSNITKDDHYNVYTTYDQGSDVNIQYVLPRPAPPPPTFLHQLSDFLNSPLGLAAGVLVTFASIAAGVLASYIQWLLRRRRKQAQQSKYNDRDQAIIANNVFLQLCQLDELDRMSNRDPQWHDIGPLADQVGAVDNKKDVAYIAEQVLLQHFHFIERVNNSHDVHKTQGLSIPVGVREAISKLLQSTLDRRIL
ncbi:MAG: hypothetical protein WA323_03600 [Candidatus Nitrosopolaris sp.]